MTMEGTKASKAGQSDPNTLFQESDFNFDGLETQNPNEFSDRLGFVQCVQDTIQNHALSSYKASFISNGLLDNFCGDWSLVLKLQ